MYPSLNLALLEPMLTPLVTVQVSVADVAPAAGVAHCRSPVSNVPFRSKSIQPQRVADLLSPAMGTVRLYVAPGTATTSGSVVKASSSSVPLVSSPFAAAAAQGAPVALRTVGLSSSTVAPSVRLLSTWAGACAPL